MEQVEVPKRLQFDAEKLRVYLEHRLPGFACNKGQLSVSKFRHGESNPTYHLRTSGGEEYVLRRRPPGKLLPGAHRVDREFRVLSALHTVHFPLPRPLLLCSDISVIGTEFYLMECVKFTASDVISMSMALMANHFSRPSPALSEEDEAIAPDLPQIGLEEMLGAMSIQDSGKVVKDEDVVMTE